MRRNRYLTFIYGTIISFAFISNANSATYTVNTTADTVIAYSVGTSTYSLREAMIDASIEAMVGNGTNATIQFAIPDNNPTITLTSPPPALVARVNLTMSGNNTARGGGTVTIKGASAYNAFWIYNGTANISNFNIQNCYAFGGCGLGAGAALFVNNLATVTLTNVNINNSYAKTGNGGTDINNVGAGGEGRMNGSGGNCLAPHGITTAGRGVNNHGGDSGYFPSGGGGVLGNGGSTVSVYNGCSSGGSINGNGGTASESSSSGGSWQFSGNASIGGGNSCLAVL